MEMLAQGMRSLRHGVLSQIPKPLYVFARQLSLLTLNAISLGKGRSVKVAGIYPLQVEWERSSVDFTTWEAEFIKEFGKTLQTKRVVFDVGASIGEWSALASTLVGSENVHVFEPDLPSFKNIEIVFKLNNLSAPAGIFSGFLANQDSFEEDIWQQVSSHQFPPKVNGQAGFQSIKYPQDLPIAKLDTYCLKTKVIPEVIKIDVEGAEGEVLRGGEYVLQNYHPIIFLSLHPWALQDFGDTKSDLLNWIEQKGYVCRLLAIDHEEHWICEPKI
ncbi:FkbM family methyltransferase [Pseudanabaena yagii]|uniref:FkbM family methyltransferase n=1 Tax=Pseudanabaena yagii GIHE-NHR1 TaxID=2722753 RepID=A0ABX1LW64_9CYAN|nr:FkbM family methyltransferase [Pseudanabaena yagii]NMF60428.1 FkbM family methyltransferase [Pseudanabaena yagii GIHE-NHR1]